MIKELFKIIENDGALGFDPNFKDVCSGNCSCFCTSSDPNADDDSEDDRGEEQS